jgi:hypothetical protein
VSFAFGRLAIGRKLKRGSQGLMSTLATKIAASALTTMAKTSPA